MANLFDGIFEKYEKNWKFIYRPPRQKYSEETIGRETGSEVEGVAIKREDIVIKNIRKERIKCSLFKPQRVENQRIPCVVYLHGNSGSRMESLCLLNYLMPLNVALFCFDFTGCGLSDGNYVTLGVNEQDDAEAVLSFLKDTGEFTSFVLWGRSMGAVTALLYASKNPGIISALILDSPYYCFKKVVQDMARIKLNIPGLIMDAVIALLKKKLIKIIGVDIFQIDLRKTIENMESIPICFCYSKEDQLILPYHSEALYKAYLNEKKRIYFQGDHNEIRPASMFDEAISFLGQTVYIAGLSNQSEGQKNLNFLKLPPRDPRKLDLNIERRISFISNLGDHTPRENTPERASRITLTSNQRPSPSTLGRKDSTPASRFFSKLLEEEAIEIEKTLPKQKEPWFGSHKKEAKSMSLRPGIENTAPAKSEYATLEDYESESFPLDKNILKKADNPMLLEQNKIQKEIQQQMELMQRNQQIILEQHHQVLQQELQLQQHKIIQQQQNIEEKRLIQQQLLLEQVILQSKKENNEIMPPQENLASNTLHKPERSPIPIYHTQSKSDINVSRLSLGGKPPGTQESSTIRRLGPKLSLAEKIKEEDRKFNKRASVDRKEFVTSIDQNEKVGLFHLQVMKTQSTEESELKTEHLGEPEIKNNLPKAIIPQNILPFWGSSSKAITEAQPLKNLDFQSNTTHSNLLSKNLNPTITSKTNSNSSNSTEIQENLLTANYEVPVKPTFKSGNIAPAIFPQKKLVDLDNKIKQNQPKMQETSDKIQKLIEIQENSIDSQKINIERNTSPSPLAVAQNKINMVQSGGKAPIFQTGPSLIRPPCKINSGTTNSTSSFWSAAKQKSEVPEEIQRNKFASEQKLEARFMSINNTKNTHFQQQQIQPKAFSPNQSPFGNASIAEKESINYNKNDYKARETVINFIKCDSTERAIKKINPSEQKTKKSSNNKENECSPPNYLIKALQPPSRNPSLSQQNQPKEIKFVSLMPSEVQSGKNIQEILPFSPTQNISHQESKANDKKMLIVAAEQTQKDRQALGLQTRLMNINVNPMTKY